MGMRGDSGVGWVRIGMNGGIQNDGWRGEDGAMVIMLYGTEILIELAEDLLNCTSFEEISRCQ